MCVTIEKEQAVAGYVNQHEDGQKFTIKDLNNYVMSLWNVGCGPIRLNFTQRELKEYLELCRKICLRDHCEEYVIDKVKLVSDMTKDEYNFWKDDTDRARSFALFCKLQVDVKTPDYLLDAMGFRFMYA